jgi:Tol biopolymer transport system component
MGDRKPVWFPDGRIQPITNSTLRVHVDHGEVREERVTHTVPLGTLSRDGKTMYVGEAASEGTPGGIVAYDAITGDRRGRVALPQGAGSIALSPDGQSWAFTTRDDTKDTTQRVARVNLDGSDYCVLHTGNIGGSFAVWSADGTAILFAEDGEQRVRLMRVQASGGAAEPVGIEVEGFFGFDVSPDGKHVAYGTTGGSTEIWTLDVSSSFKK